MEYDFTAMFDLLIYWPSLSGHEACTVYIDINMNARRQPNK